MFFFCVFIHTIFIKLQIPVDLHPHYFKEYINHFHLLIFKPQSNKKWNSSHRSLKWYPCAHDICLTLICIDYLGSYCTPAVPYIMESMGLQVCGELRSLTPRGLTSCCTFAVNSKSRFQKLVAF